MKQLNLIPMAGRGQRFLDAGYRIPKPLIEIEGRFMIDHAASSLPLADGWIFICQKEHDDEAGISEQLKKRYTNAEVILLDHLTEGQASTCMLAESLVDDNTCINIGACDNAMIYDRDLWAESINDADILVWTFRNNPAVLQKPEMYSWASTPDGCGIRNIAVKRPLSNEPMQDHALIGAFTFRKAYDFFSCGHEMHDKRRMINGEFYIDELVNVGLQRGLKAKVFEVSYYIGWGTPCDLKTYHYWKNSLDYFLGNKE